MERLQRLKTSQIALESFLERWVETKGRSLVTLEGLAELDAIVGRARVGVDVGSLLNVWMTHFGKLAENSELSPEDRHRISGMLLELSARSKPMFRRWPSATSPGATPEMPLPLIPLKKSEGIEVNASTGGEGESPRRIILKRRPESREGAIAEKIGEILRLEQEHFVNAYPPDEHALTRLDDILKSAAVRGDLLYLHLAGSLIYYFKLSGYKVEPYVKRLREIEDRFSAVAATPQSSDEEFASLGAGFSQGKVNG